MIRKKTQRFRLGVQLRQKDLQAIEKLFRVRWNATISNWKERGCEGCLWKVTCPDTNNHIITKNGLILSETIEKLLEEIKGIENERKRISMSE